MWRKRMIDRMKEIYLYRNMIAGLVKRDLRGRYKGSVLGFFWNLINPLCQIIVYILVFSNIFRSGIENYYLFLVIGMMPWLFFSDSMVQGASCVVAQSNMTKKIYFPREILTISTVTSRFINMLITFCIVFVLIIFSGIGFNFKALVYLPLILIMEYCLTLGIALLLSAINVYFRDVEHITGVLMMAMVWITPVMYTADMATGIVYKIIRLNPMTPIIESYKEILFYKVIPNGHNLIISAVVAIVALVIGELVFVCLEGNFAEEL